MTENFEAFQEKYDLRRLEMEETDKRRAHEIDLQRYGVKIERAKIVAISVGCIALAAAIIGVSYIIWLGTRGPSAADQEEAKVRIACIDQGGTWLKVEDGSNGGSGTCVMSGGQ